MPRDSGYGEDLDLGMALPPWVAGEKRLSPMLPYVSLVTDRTIRTRGNELMQCIRLEGVNSTTSEDAHLDRIGIKDERDRNQIANFALTEWLDNAEISSRSPEDYAPERMAGFSADQIARMHSLNALPDKWWLLPYQEFLETRRELMSGVIQAAYRKLSGHHQAEVRPLSVEELIRGGEGELVEYKSTLRMNLHTHKPDEKMESSVLKTIAGFMNAQGGTLVIGVRDAGTPLGLEADGFPNEDKMALHLVNLVKARLGTDAMPFIHLKFEDVETGRALSVTCEKGHRAVFLKDGQEQRFYVRSGPSSAELQGADQIAYISRRFRT